MYKGWKLSKDWALEVQGELKRAWMTESGYAFQAEVELTTKKADHHGLRLTLRIGEVLFASFQLYNVHHAEWFVPGKEWPEGEEPLTLEEMAQNYIYSGELTEAMATEGLAKGEEDSR